MKKLVFGWGALALALISFVPAVKGQIKSPSPVHTSRAVYGDHQYLSIDVDSSTTPPQVIAVYKSDALYNMILREGRLTSLYVNGKPVSADSLYLYDELVKRIKDQMRRDSLQAIRDREQAARDREQADRDREQAVRDKEQAERDAEQAIRDKKYAEEDGQQAVRDNIQAKRDAEQAMRDKEQAVRAAIDAKIEAERDAKQAARDKIQAEQDAKQAIRDKEQAERDAEQAIRDKKQAEEDKALVQSLLADVIKEGLAPDEKSVVSLILDESVFFINGKKQSDELQKKFREKYIRQEGFSIYFHHGSTSIGRMY